MDRGPRYSINLSEFNETFKIHTDDSAFQLGAVIRKKGKQIDFYGRNLLMYNNGKH